ncbi:RNA-guided endonuclease InsQ/TnpB family protein [Spirulina major]|uniref:RNA-guided endonuclease InsQ/TnpB family protein n=1 Tax=Spirulina major TaxID=270636 RepID=UPI000932CBD5|nr:RNA-guided endonuclease TnpB family protein [Spirulina major]
MKTLKFKLYQHKRNRYLKRTINAAGRIYNHCVALHKRYYRIWGKHLNCARLQKHIAKLRKRNPWWLQVGSQAVQDICQRIEKAYQLFFKHNQKGVRPPNFKKTRKYKSFTLKQAGYKFLGGNRVRIGNKVYQYWHSRPIEGKVKTVTIKRTPLGELWMIVTVDTLSEPQVKTETGNIAGFDFGLKTFLTCSEGFKIDAPLFFKQSLNAVRKLTNQFDVLCFETLNLKAMQRLWGRKVSDLAFREFLQILEWVATKKGKRVVYVDRWFPSSKTCSSCGHILEHLDLETRHWRCPSCSTENDRDENAAMNIKVAGASAIGLGDVRQALPAIAV